MSKKKFILNADDFGMSNAFNKAVLEAYHKGFLKSASICANGSAFEAAVNEIIPECPNLGIGVHLNIIEGQSLQDFTQAKSLTNPSSNFNNNYIKLIYLSENDWFLEQVEREFRLQIEKVLNFTPLTHLDSHVHTHAIPKIFDLVCKLAEEYGISQVRTQFEEPYIVPNFKKHLNIKYPPNILKVLLLNYFTLKNKIKIENHDLNTNDFLIGVGYTGMMDEETIYQGLCAIEEEKAIVECLIHPCNFDGATLKDSNYKEFMITQNMDLKDKIQRLGFEICNYKNTDER